MSTTPTAPPTAPPAASPTAPQATNGRKVLRVEVPPEVVHKLVEGRDRIDRSTRPVGLNDFAVKAIEIGLREIAEKVPDWVDPFAGLNGGGR